MVLRKKTDIVQLSKIRIREALRAQLARDAERKRVTLNGEIVDRLEKSYEPDRMRKIAEIWRGAVPVTGQEHPAQSGSATPVFRETVFQKGQMTEGEDERDRRDSEIIDVLLSRNEASSRLLRAITLELATKPEWSSSKAGISDMAEAVRIHVYAAQHRSESTENAENNK